MTNLVNLIYLTGFFLGLCDGYKILIVFPNTGKSHKILGEGYVDSLLEAGHEVTLITPYPSGNRSQNFTQIDVSHNLKFDFGQLVTLANVLDGVGTPNSKYTVFSVMHDIARSTVESEGVQRLLKDKEQRFDLVIAEWLFSDFYAAFSAVFNCPYIWSVSMNPSWLVLRLVDRPRNPEYYPDMHSANNPPFSPTTRLQEFQLQMNVIAMKKFIFNGLERQLYKDSIVPILRGRGRNIPEYQDIVYNVSLLAVNSHAILAQIMPMPPNCVTIGGYHIGVRIPPLEAELQKLMHEAKNGVIYFSLGTNLSSETLPKHMIQSLLNMFKEMKQLVLWKLDDSVTDLPKNVHILPWAPQQSILNHPNCVLFITHGGYLSLTEAVHFSVPVVVIPVFGDQFANAAKSELRGIGKKVDYTYNLVRDLRAAIREVIGNPSFKQNVDQLSTIYHDQKSPRARLVHWVDYVIRTGGAVHLRSPPILMPWYQEVYFDLLLLILAGIFAIWYCVTIMVRLVLQ